MCMWYSINTIHFYLFINSPKYKHFICYIPYICEVALMKFWNQYFYFSQCVYLSKTQGINSQISIIIIYSRFNKENIILSRHFKWDNLIRKIYAYKIRWRNSSQKRKKGAVSCQFCHSSLVLRTPVSYFCHVIYCHLLRLRTTRNPTYAVVCSTKTNNLQRNS